MGNWKNWGGAVALILILSTNRVFAFNAPPDVPTWCGKPYMSTNQALDPGGQFQFPAYQKDALLYVTVQPRYTIFLESDATGTFVVDASISHFFGEPYHALSYDTSENTNTGQSFNALKIKIYNDESGSLLVSDSVSINSTGNIFKFSLSSFTPRLKPYSITLYGTTSSSKQSYTTKTEIFVLPPRTSGSAVKIDNLHGGLYVQNAFNNWKGWYPIFPNGGYADGGYVIPSVINYTNLETYSTQGYNTINIVPDGGAPEQSYPTEVLATYWDKMDTLNLFNIYDMRFAFQNETRIRDQVSMWENRTTLLMWYTADEPDGWAYPLNSTSNAYTLLQELDPYHPVSLVLNCQNFYYSEYSSGADIIFQDAYPIGINATWSIPWNTPCNTTYGDCGCDNCVGSLFDVASRLEDIQEYQSFLPGGKKKPTWSVLQAFGNQDYWPTLPTAQEVKVMMMLSVNHGAKGITYWIYPSTEDVDEESGALGMVFRGEKGMGFIFGTEPVRGLPVEGNGGSMVDVSAWVDTGEGKMMVGVAYWGYERLGGLVTIELPEEVTGVDEVLYGNGGWVFEGRKLARWGMEELDVSILVLNIAPWAV